MTPEMIKAKNARLNKIKHERKAQAKRERLASEKPSEPTTIKQTCEISTQTDDVIVLPANLPVDYEAINEEINVEYPTIEDIEYGLRNSKRGIERHTDKVEGFKAVLKGQLMDRCIITEYVQKYYLYLEDLRRCEYAYNQFVKHKELMTANEEPVEEQAKEPVEDKTYQANTQKTYLDLLPNDCLDIIYRLAYKSMYDDCMNEFKTILKNEHVDVQREENFFRGHHLTWHVTRAVFSVCNQHKYNRLHQKATKDYVEHQGDMNVIKVGDIIVVQEGYSHNDYLYKIVKETEKSFVLVKLGWQMVETRQYGYFLNTFSVIDMPNINDVSAQKKTMRKDTIKLYSQYERRLRYAYGERCKAYKWNPKIYAHDDDRIAGVWRYLQYNE